MHSALYTAAFGASAALSNKTNAVSNCLISAYFLALSIYCFAVGNKDCQKKYAESKMTIVAIAHKVFNKKYDF